MPHAAQFETVRNGLNVGDACSQNPQHLEGWLIAEPTVSAKMLMGRLAAMVPDAYASKAQLRTLQRRVKAWRAERAKEMILGRLRKSTGIPAEV